MCELVGLIVGWVCIIADSNHPLDSVKTSWFDLQVWGFSSFVFSYFIFNLPPSLSLTCTSPRFLISTICSFLDHSIPGHVNLFKEHWIGISVNVLNNQTILLWMSTIYFLFGFPNPTYPFHPNLLQMWLYHYFTCIIEIFKPLSLLWTLVWIYPIFYFFYQFILLLDRGQKAINDSPKAINDAVGMHGFHGQISIYFCAWGYVFIFIFHFEIYFRALVHVTICDDILLYYN